MTITIETFKNIATVIGCITAAIGLITLISKSVRTRLTSFIVESSDKSGVESQLKKITDMIEQNEKADAAFRNRIEKSLSITLDATVRSLRLEIKDIYTKYKDTKILPIYEKKAILDIQELYIDKLHQNHWGKTLLDEMMTWEVDPKTTDVMTFALTGEPGM